jgi:hypothetical protein
LTLLSSSLSDDIKLESLFFFLQNNSFNAIRVPLSVELIINDPYAVISPSTPNPEFLGKKGMQVLDQFITTARK